MQKCLLLFHWPCQYTILEGSKWPHCPTRLLELTCFLLFLKVAFIRGVHLSQNTYCGGGRHTLDVGYLLEKCAFIRSFTVTTCNSVYYDHQESGD